ncbi:hypothetical protein OC842_001986 [Tilletia horrida]|uniref:SPT2-domain-containing protein n=1 Tax=Tilletia horrida TaxID=155126 RepID=A0AAN6GEH8_9BASI|nr:hypothetical protein OC842_001986 [Tilletia horrida]
MDDYNLKREAIARAEAQRAKLLAEAERQAKAEQARRRAADAGEKREAERRRAMLAAQQKRRDEEARMQREVEERRKREAEMDESELPDLARGTSAARMLMSGTKGNKASAAAAASSSGPARASATGRAVNGKALETTGNNAAMQSGSSTGSGAGMMATFNSVVRKTARKKGPADTSLLTREEKRQRKLAASLGGDKRTVSRSGSLGSLRGAASHAPVRSASHSSLPKFGGTFASGSASSSSAPAISAKSQALPSFTRKAAVIGADKTFTEAITLGQKKRDNRSIDEIERDLRAAKEAKLLKEGGLKSSELEERKRREEEHRKLEEKRKLAMAEKRRLDLEAQGIFVSPSLATSHPPVKEPDPSQRARARTSSPVVNQRLLAAAEFHNRKASPSPTPLKSHTNGIKAERVELVKGKRDRSGRLSGATHKDASPGPTASAPSPGSTLPVKKETEREKFIREEAERKKRAAAGSVTDGSVNKKGKAVQRLREEAPDDDEEEEEDDDDADSFIVDDLDDMDEGGQEDEDEEDEDDRRYRKKHKAFHQRSRATESSRSRSRSSRDGGSGGGDDYRDEIWRIMGRDRRAYVDMDDSDDDMEATAADIAREEFRSTRIAKKEDEQEQAAEEQHARDKAVRLQKLAAKARARR